MRIALFHDLPTGGAKRVVDQHARRLVAAGHRVDAFLPSTADESFLPLDVSVVRVFDRPAAPDRARLLGAAATPLDAARWATYVHHVFRVERQIARAIDQGGYDVVLVHPSQFTQAPSLLRMLRTPSLYYCHEPLRAAHEPWFAPAWVRFGVRHTLGRVDRVNARAATVIAANSRFTARRCRALYGRPLRVAYPGVDSAHFRPLGGERSGFVLCVGALHRSKGQGFILDALATIPRQRRPKLVLVADRVRDAERQRVSARAAQLDIDVELAIRVAEDVLIEMYDRCGAVLYAPHDEPLGLVPLEAMACEAPVVAVNEGGMRETVRSGTGILSAREPAAFGQAVAQLLEHSDRAEAMGRNARRYVIDHWNWERAIRRLEALLGRAARRRDVS
ncbi:MAG TPA: glycosyltransferase family 4 protein [Longimicrobiales bacterium]